MGILAGRGLAPHHTGNCNFLFPLNVRLVLPRPEPEEFLFPVSVHRKVPGLPLVTLGESPVAIEGTEADLSHMKLMVPPGGQILLQGTDSDGGEGA